MTQPPRFRSDRNTSGQHSLTREEYEKLLAATDDIEDELILKMAVSTGLRREDLFSITINNIDLQNKKLTFYEAKKRRMRTIDLQANVAQLIIKYLKTIDKRERLFSIKGRAGYDRFNNLCRKAGIPERPFHALRATCIKFCQASGWTQEQVAQLVGDTLEVIHLHYTTPSVQEMNELVRDKPTV